MPCARVGVIAVVLMLMAGCAGQREAPQSAAPAERAGAAVAASLQDVLERAPTGSRYRLPQSPWGEGVAVELRDAYTAASGRMCRRVTIDPAGASQPGLACRRADGHWQSVRVLHDHGRPILAGQALERYARSRE
jgi:surface antigen